MEHSIDFSKLQSGIYNSLTPFNGGKIDLSDLIGGNGPVDLRRWLGEALDLDGRIKEIANRLANDWDRVELFQVATQRWYTNAVRELVEALVRGDLVEADRKRQQIVVFTMETAVFTRNWVKTIADEVERVRKLNWRTFIPFLLKLPSYDPLKQMREASRQLVKDWQLGNDVAAALGVKDY